MIDPDERRAIRNYYKGLKIVGEDINNLIDDLDAAENRIKDLGNKLRMVADAHLAAEEKIVELEARPTFAQGFKKGQESVLRKNPSGCCCLFDENENIISLCGAHQEYVEAKTGEEEHERS